MSIPSGLSTPGATVNFSSLESMFGPLLIGVLFSAALWGITCVQTYDYFITPNEDAWWQKFVVALLLFLDTFDTVLNTVVLYHYLVKNFGNPSALLSVLWISSCRSLVNALASFIVRGMFARRVYLVSGKNKLLCLWIVATSSAHFVVGILITVQSLLGKHYKGLPSLSHLLYISFSLGIVSDASITGSLYWLLHSLKTGIRRTNSLVKVLMTYVVTTCLLVVADSTLGFILYIAKPNTLIYMGFYLLLGKLYINAFLSSLNAREKLGKNQTDVVLSLSRVSARTGQNQNSSITTYDKPSHHRSDNAMSIKFQTTVERKTDNLEIKDSGSVDVV